MPSAKSDTPKTTRVTTVQVPGESPSSPEVKEEVSTATTLAAADNPAVGKEEGQSNEGTGDAPAAGPTVEDLAALQAENEELRAQIAAAGRAPAAGPTVEDLAALQAENEELRAQIAAAGRAPAAGREVKPVQNRADYLNMRAADVDPETLTKAVLTKDGWVCPPAIAKAQPK